MDNFEPNNFKEWLERVFSIRSMTIFLLVLGAFITEFRFDWIERALGSYLVKTNIERPESGAIWEIGHRNITAQKTLEQIITDRQTIHREARDATTFAQVAANISSNKGGIMLSPDHFRTLYLGLPSSIAQEIVSPFELIKILSNGNWDRTYFGKMNEILIIFLLDKNNRVIRQLNVPSEVLSHIKQDEINQIGTLDNFPKFKDRIYPAFQFFEALESLSEDVRWNVISQPENLLKTGHVVRVGISDETVSGFIELGFEIESENQKRMILHRSPEWAVWLLRSKLEDKERTLRPLPFDGQVGRTQ